MIGNQQLAMGILSLGVAAFSSSAADAGETAYCIKVGAGFGSGGTTFIGVGFSVPAAGSCTPWAGFTKTATTVILTTTGTGCLSSNGKVLTVSAISMDPAYLGAGQMGADFITLCPAGVKGCPLGGGEDVGAFAGTAAPENCTPSLLNLPATHD